MAAEARKAFLNVICDRHGKKRSGHFIRSAEGGECNVELSKSVSGCLGAVQRELGALRWDGNTSILHNGSSLRPKVQGLHTDFALRIRRKGGAWVDEAGLASEFEL